MSDFELFKQANEEYEKAKSQKNTEESTKCPHSNVITEKASSICTDCGEEIRTKISETKEWRYYGSSDTKYSSDPNRVQVRKTNERSIHKDVANMGFSEHIVAQANMIYTKVTPGISRGNMRTSIVFACIFNAFKLNNNPQSQEKLMKVFGIGRKACLKGLKYVNLYAPKDLKIHTTYITPVNLLDEIMSNFDATDKQKEEVRQIYKKVENKSSRLNRSRPKSVSSGVVYYWIRKKGKDVSLTEFSEKVSLSELTIVKIAKEIATILKTPDVI